MKTFHGWRMVAAGSAIQFMQAATLHQAFGAYFAALVDEKGWSKTALSGVAVMQPMEAALLGPALGWIVDRFGPQGMIRIGIVMFGIGFMLLSLIDSLPGFYAAFLVIALGSSLCGFFPINVAIIHWFHRLRARALSSVGLGLALGGLLVPLVAASIERFGWRSTALASGCLVIIIGWPLAQVFRRHPADLGQTVDGLPPAPDGAEHDPLGDRDQQEFTARQALRTRAFWFISFGHGLALMIVYAINVHAIKHMKEGLGYTLGQASL
ncbi:MAG: MFS transporter, partial [Lautropia sp.]